MSLKEMSVPVIVLTRRAASWLLLIVLVVGSACGRQKMPGVFLVDAATLVAAQRAYTVTGSKYAPAIQSLMKAAERAMNAKPVSVMEKSEAPPSGDKHDYMSVAPYWWPDSSKPSGVPYIRRDGEINPEHDFRGDRTLLGAMLGTVRTLALAYFISRNEEFAARACLHLRAWFLDTATRMNPNLRYAQSITGIVDGRGIGIIDTYGFREVIDAMQLLSSSEQWSQDLDRGMRTWFSEYLDWLLTSTNGREESAARNNHGTTYDVQVASIALYLGKLDVVRKVARAAGEKRIAVQIEPDGSQPLELERTKSWGYSVMNTEALVSLALLAKQVDVDLWHWSTSDGRSLVKAIDFLLPYALNQRSWTSPQIVPMDKDRMYSILQITSMSFENEQFTVARRKLFNTKIQASRAFLQWPHTTGSGDAH